MRIEKQMAINMDSEDEISFDGFISKERASTFDSQKIQQIVNGNYLFLSRV